MQTASEIVGKYISFFEKRGHKRIPNSPLVPENDPTTLFTSSGMQPLVSYLLGEEHPQGKRLVNVQNCFRAQDIDEIGDNRHTTFFRMLGNWSLGDYFKKEELPWFFELLTEQLRLDPKRLYVTVFDGYKNIKRDEESARIWHELFESRNIDPTGRVFYYGATENWWSRAGVPDEMPVGEPGGPDSEVFFDLYPNQGSIGNDLKKHSRSGRLLEIGNSVFMQYQKHENGFTELPKKNVDFGGGLERLLAAVEDKKDIFQTSLFASMIQVIKAQTHKDYLHNRKSIQIIVDHFIATTFMAASDLAPSNKEQGYVMRRLIRRGFDNFYQLGGREIAPVLEAIVEQYRATDPYLVEKFEHTKGLLLEEEQKYKRATGDAKKFIQKKYQMGGELKGVAEISASDAFLLYTTHGLSPTQIKSLGYAFAQQEFAEKMKTHQEVSRKGAKQKFQGGLADHQEKTIMGHTATHLLHQALRDVLGKHIYQTGSNITAKRVRFDFNYDQKISAEHIQQIENRVNDKIKQDIPVHFEMLPTEDAKKMGAIGLFQDTYTHISKIYFIGGSSKEPRRAYSIEFCGGPHVERTGTIKQFKITKQENIGRGQHRLYAIVNS